MSVSVSVSVCRFVCVYDCVSVCVSTVKSPLSLFYPVSHFAHSQPHHHGNRFISGASSWLPWKHSRSPQKIEDYSMSCVKERMCVCVGCAVLSVVVIEREKERD